MIGRLWRRVFPAGVFGCPVRDVMDGMDMDGLPRMDLMRAAWTTREGKLRLLAERLGKYLGGSILDLGADQCYLREILGKERRVYCGLDRWTEGATYYDLERGRLPYDRDRWDTVCCIDVLEHLEAIHEIFAEAVRCAREYLVVTLPNCWQGYHEMLRCGYGTIGKYGLPVRMPPDRHRWFCNFDDADAFLATMGRWYNLRVVERIALYSISPWPGWKRPYLWLRFWMGKRRRSRKWRNRFLMGAWWVYQKSESG